MNPYPWRSKIHGSMDEMDGFSRIKMIHGWLWMDLMEFVGKSGGSREKKLKNLKNELCQNCVI
jgi:hypothetical protein